MQLEDKRKIKLGCWINLLALGFSLMAVGYFLLSIIVEITKARQNIPLYYYVGIGGVLLWYAILFVAYFVIKRHINKPFLSITAMLILVSIFGLGLWISGHLMAIIFPLYNGIWPNIYFCILFLIIAVMAITGGIKYILDKHVLGRSQYVAGIDYGHKSWRNNEMSKNQELRLTPKFIRGARTIYVILIAAILIAIIGLSVLQLTGHILRFKGEKPPFWLTELLPVFVSIICLLSGYFWPSLGWKFKTSRQPEAGVFQNCWIRAIFFVDALLVSLAFGLLGSNFYVIIAILIITGIVSFITFPTGERWSNWLTALKKNINSNSTNE